MCLDHNLEADLRTNKGCKRSATLDHRRESTQLSIRQSRDQEARCLALRIGTAKWVWSGKMRADRVRQVTRMTERGQASVQAASYTVDVADV